MFKYILFDFDGTLFDTAEGVTKSVQYALKKRGIDAELSALRCFVGPPLQEKFMEMYGFDEDEAMRAVEDFRERYKPIGVHECRIFPGVPELIKNLHAAGFRLGVASSKPLVHIIDLLGENGLAGYFDALCGSTPGGKDSAKWEIILQAMEKLGAKREDTVLVGDTKYDVFGAKRCLIPCIGVRYGCAAEGELEEAGADCIVEDTRELEKLLMS